MQALLDVILPVFLVVLAGYLVVWRGWIGEDTVEALMKFAQNFAIPTLLFLALARLDLSQIFEWRTLVSFYTGALSGCRPISASSRCTRRFAIPSAF